MRPRTGSEGPPLGVLLLEDGLVSPEDLARALVDQGRSGSRLGEILREWGLVSRPLLDRMLARQSGVVLETEDGFGAGLRGRIERRHLERVGVSMRKVRSPDPPAPPLVDRRLGERRTHDDRRGSS
jgi:hypothetical protein